jgi:hypothetical protein
MESRPHTAEVPLDVVTRVLREPGQGRGFANAVAALARGTSLRLVEPPLAGQYGGVIEQLVAGLVCEALRNPIKRPETGEM